MRILFALSLLFVSPMSSAQDSETPASTDSETTKTSERYVPKFLGGDFGRGFVVTPATRLTGVGGQPALTVGGRAGWLFHHTLAIGLEGHLLASPTVWHRDDQQVLSMNYAGFFADGILGAKRPVHGILHVFWGFGEAHWRQSGDVTQISETTSRMMMELQASVAYAPYEWLRVSAGPGFRFSPGGELMDLESGDFWAPYAELSVAVGLF